MAGMVQQSAHQVPQKKKMKERTMEVTKPQSAADESEGPEVADLGCTTTMLVLGFNNGGEGHYTINVSCAWLSSLPAVYHEMGLLWTKKSFQ